MSLPHPTTLTSIHASLPHFLPSPALASPVGSPSSQPNIAVSNAPCSTLFVANLGQFVSEHELKDIFSRSESAPSRALTFYRSRSRYFNSSSILHRCFLSFFFFSFFSLNSLHRDFSAWKCFYGAKGWFDKCSARFSTRVYESFALRNWRKIGGG